MKGYKHMNEKKFNQIKGILAVDGVTRALVSKVAKVSPPTVMRVEKAKTFTDYKKSFIKTVVKQKTQLDRIEDMLNLLLKDRKERGWLERAMG